MYNTDKSENCNNKVYSCKQENKKIETMFLYFSWYAHPLVKDKYIISYLVLPLATMASWNCPKNRHDVRCSMNEQGSTPPDFTLALYSH